MAFRIGLCGTTTQRTGTEESYLQLAFTGEGEGINLTAKWKDNGDKPPALMWRQGMNTYVGVVGRTPGKKGPWPCRGLYYHDNEGGPSGNIPRGTFNFTAFDLTDLPPSARVIAFDGSYSDSTAAGAHYAVIAGFDDARNPQCPPSHGQWQAGSNTLTLVSGQRLLVGRWATSSSNVDKWAGVFYNTEVEAPTVKDFDLTACPDGTFLLYPADLPLDD
eukprot:TRINITY_DN21256_c0_g1_i1.p1 TRINITY_DN21256_c0_g1~~TRINITY_DN21256_c0_g1_i1.p1  ORF type:complete len:218 (+),score=83.47 TRINITY_DN21256_c0_g1_i1:56-709(+)